MARVDGESRVSCLVVLYGYMQPSDSRTLDLIKKEIQ